MILHNPSEKDIIDYRIEEAEFDSRGNMVIDTNTNRPKWTGNTLEWTIKAGEKVDFPDYVAEYLKYIYPFLKEVKPVVTVSADGSTGPSTSVSKKAEGKLGGSFKCKYCPKSFTTKKGLGLHMGFKHYEKL